MDPSRGLITGTLISLLTAALCYNSDDLQDLRLAGGDSRCEGRVEVNIRGEWGTVCDDAWSDKNTEVVCRQLGCPQAPTNSVKTSSFGAGIGTIWLTDVTCSGEETLLGKCKYSIEEGDICHHKNDVGVICSGEAEELKLVGGGSECEGRVEVKHRGEWGTVCGVNWHRRDAAVVCRQLGCNFTNIAQVKAASFGPGSGRIWLSHVKCVGDESKLWSCQRRMWGSGQCKHQDDAGVICSAAPADLRLMGGNTECEGRLEVKHQGEWGTVCGEYWQKKEAEVVCRQLGCTSFHGEAAMVKATSFGPGSGRIWFSDVTCSGEESDLWQCKHQMWGNPFCQHKQDVGVICAGEPEEIKLVDGQTECEGRLMVKQWGEWGSVCGYYWGVSEATVACRQMGCGSLWEDGVQAKAANFGAGSGRIWLSHVRCTGRESTLAMCHHLMWGFEGCGHKDEVGVVCEDRNTGMSSQFRLVNGSQRCSGRVEKIYDGRWGAVCGEYWDLRAANVLCRQLGCGIAVSIPLGGYFGEKNPVWKEEFHCKGTESNLKHCTKVALGNQNCPDCNTAGVICTGKAETLRLVDGPGHCEGRLEVLQDNVWGRVLDHQWDMKEAEVVCRQLHCGDAIGAFKLKEPAGGAVAWDSVTCEGNEKHIENCSISINGSSMVSTHHALDVGVICSEHSRSVRLTENIHRCAGLVEVYQKGEWGVISGDGSDLKDGEVICRELSCGHVINVGRQAVIGTPKLWLSGLNCIGNENVLRQCPYDSWGTSDAQVKEATRVVCSETTNLRLVGGANECEGRLEVFYNGSWGSVCSNLMSSHSISVICKQLNCGTSGQLEASFTYGLGAAPYWLDRIECHSRDSSLSECPSAPWGHNNCSPSEVAQISCEISKRET
ncbi:scavenger receptor cysteine-rich type 1 protein M130 isoform X2 [Pyxicephalus adspersus]|uniref:scavenger receptor cysteine-rich type 1 protein M130 isoform X2 n=1 Tax=Pyxicephalus adspersus TaxID=30357 RepID=UPI003B59F698